MAGTGFTYRPTPEGRARLLADMVGAELRVQVTVEDDLVTTAARVRTALEQTSDGFVVTTGGDCGVELQPIAAARRGYGGRLVVVASVSLNGFPGRRAESDTTR